MDDSDKKKYQNYVFKFSIQKLNIQNMIYNIIV